MAVRPVTLASFKATKNAVIGNPSAKHALAQDDKFIQTLVECVNHLHTREGDPQGFKDDIRIEVSHIIASISYGSEEALASLLRANTLHALLYAINNIQPSDKSELRSAFARALRALAAALADVVGPSHWGLRPQTSDLRLESKAALNHLFQPESMDIYLPLLASDSIPTITWIAQLIAYAVRDPTHRNSVTDWLPPADRLREGKGKRGWEKPDTTNHHAPSRHGGWVVRHLCAILSKTRDLKVQEAVLLALAAMSKNSPTIALTLAKPADKDHLGTLITVLSFTKSRSTDVQLAACSCATNIFRSCSASHPNYTDTSMVMSILHVLNRMIGSPIDSHTTRMKACFILSTLVQDDPELCCFVHYQRSLEILSDLLKSITPLSKDSEWEEDEPESLCSLREAALTTIATISIFDHDIRVAVADGLNLIPYINVSINHKHVGIRYGACQCVRSLSREVSVLRTNILDSGLGKTTFQIFMKEDEDRRVTSAAMMCICNLVNEFSPLRPICLEGGLLIRLVQLLDSPEISIRLNALWAMKNLLRKSTLDTKKDAVQCLTWDRLSNLMLDPDVGIQEQALSIARNLAEDEFGIELLFAGLGSEVLLTRITSALGSSNSDVVLQATNLLANLVNGSEAHQDSILSHPQILPLLRSCLASKAEIRRPAVSCILHVAFTATSERRREIVQAGIVSTLRHISEWSGGHDVSVGGRTPTHPHQYVLEQDVVEQARMAVDRLEHSGEAWRTQ